MSHDFESQKEKFLSELSSRAPDMKCPVCGSNEFTFGGGFFAHDLQKTFKERQIGGLSIPTVPISCKNCGFILEFAAGTLGLLPKPSETEDEK